MSQNAVAAARGLATSVYSMSLQSIGLSLSLAAALAWNEAVKFFIRENVKVGGSGLQYYLVYAAVATLIAVFFYYVLRALLL